MLAVILMVHDGARVAVKDFGQLFWCNPPPPPRLARVIPTLMSIKNLGRSRSCFMSSPTLCNFTFQVA